MLCDECKQLDATFHSIKKINGITSEQHLCPACHLKKSGSMMFDTGLGDFFSKFKSIFENDTKHIEKCSKCGTTSAQFLETGFLGCPTCYIDLADTVLPVVKKVQTGKAHDGKAPLSLQSDKTVKEYEDLKQKLNTAIESENFEEAMIIRDKMRQLRGE